MGAVKMTRKDWDAVMERYAGSGLNQAEFCKREGISYGAFSSQRNRRRKRGERLPVPVTSAPQPGAKSVEQPGPPQFIPVDIVVDRPSPEPRPELVVELPLGVTLRFRGLPAS